MPYAPEDSPLSRTENDITASSSMQLDSSNQNLTPVTSRFEIGLPDSTSPEQSPGVSPRHHLTFERFVDTPRPAPVKRKAFDGMDSFDEEDQGVKHSKVVVDEAGTHTPLRDFVDDAIIMEHTPEMATSPRKAPLT